MVRIGARRGYVTLQPRLICTRRSRANRRPVGVAASPPPAVSRYRTSISRPISPIVSITSSAGIANVMPASAISIAASAIAAPVALRKTHGSSTRPPSGSQTSPKRSLLRQRDRVRDLRRRSAEHLRRRAGGHSGRGARLRLTTAFGAGERRALGDDRADESRRRERVDHRIVGQLARGGESGEHRWKHAGPACRRRGDDDAHRGVHFLHGERAGQHIAKRRAGQRTGRAAHELRGVAADESRRAISDSPVRPCSTAPRITTSARCNTSRISPIGRP